MFVLFGSKPQLEEGDYSKPSICQFSIFPTSGLFPLTLGLNTWALSSWFKTLVEPSSLPSLSSEIILNQANDLWTLIHIFFSLEVFWLTPSVLSEVWVLGWARFYSTQKPCYSLQGDSCSAAVFQLQNYWHFESHNSLWWEGLSYRQLGSILGLYLLDASSTLHQICENQMGLRHCQMSPGDKTICN